MKLCKDIRLGEKVSGKRFELTWKLKHNRPSGSIYVVVLPEVVPEKSDGNLCIRRTSQKKAVWAHSDCGSSE